MNIKKYWMILAIVLVSLCTISCGGNDEDDALPDRNGNTTEVLTDYTATKSLKEITIATLTDEDFLGWSWFDYLSESLSRPIYEDFNRKYELHLYMGYITIVAYIRSNGNWTSSLDYVPQKIAGIIDIGNVDGINNIVSKELEEGIGYGPYINRNMGSIYKATAQPKHGYASYFITEEGVVKYMRIYVKNYTLDSDGGLSAITIQYQLY